MDATLLDRLTDVLAGVPGTPAPPLRATRLAGGYSWLSYRLRGSDGSTVIARLAPKGGTLEPHVPGREATALSVAAGAVPAPRVLLHDDDGRLVGRPFSVLTDLPGRVVRPSDPTPREDRPRYRHTFAASLGTLHAATAREGDTGQAVCAELDRELAAYAAAGWAHPGFEIGYRWLRAHRLPPSGPSVLCHGDFRLANLLWKGPGELTGILDWERAWRGDPMADIAFGRLFSGWCAVDGEGVGIYEAASGIPVDEVRVAYFMRFERWRSFTAAFRGLRAVIEGRNDDVRLAGIGLAGDSGAWDMVEWLEPGLPPLDAPPGLVMPATPVVAALDRLARLAPRLSRLVYEDHEALTASLTELARLGVVAAGDGDEAWAGAFDRLLAEARRGGPEVLPALRALGRRGTLRPDMREDLR